MTIHTEQSATYIGNRRWKWSVWLVGEKEELDLVDRVIYTLHPTFPNPVREIRTRKGGFRLMSSGWGEFTIYVDIAYGNGSHQQLSHDLKLPPSSEKNAGRMRKSPIAESAEAHEEGIAASAQHADKHVASDAEAILGQPNAGAGQQLHNPTVFISGGIADAQAVHSLREALEKLNAHTVGLDDLPAGVPTQNSVSTLIAEADLAVFLVSGRPSLRMEQEMQAAMQDNTQLLPILLGSESAPPDTLKKFKSLRLDSQKEVASLAQTILKDWT